MFPALKDAIKSDWGCHSSHSRKSQNSDSLASIVNKFLASFVRVHERSIAFIHIGQRWPRVPSYIALPTKKATSALLDGHYAKLSRVCDAPGDFELDLSRVRFAGEGDSEYMGDEASHREVSREKNGSPCDLGWYREVYYTHGKRSTAPVTLGDTMSIGSLDGKLEKPNNHSGWFNLPYVFVGVLPDEPQLFNSKVSTCLLLLNDKTLGVSQLSFSDFGFDGLLSQHASLALSIMSHTGTWLD
jgi:hypothetical protein